MVCIHSSFPCHEPSPNRPLFALKLTSMVKANHYTARIWLGVPQTSALISKGTA